MTTVKLPDSLNQSIAVRATQIARGIMQARGWKSMNALVPVWEDGKVGIKTEVKYLLYQEHGIKPFVMWSLEGKLIPIKGKDGKVRKIRAVRVGQPGWVFIPGRGRVWRAQRWRHPGLKAQNFMKTGLEMSMIEHRARIREYFAQQVNEAARGDR
jgi:hypothetical protein